MAKKKEILQVVKDSSIANIDTEDNDENVVLYNTESEAFVVSYYIQSIASDKNLIRIVKIVEKMVRSSDEYKTYLGILRASSGINNCSILTNVYDEDASIEFHHYPFTLYDVTLCVILKNLLEQKKFSTFNLASKVLKLHYDNIIGLVPLSTTVHELVHANKLFIPLESVLGDYLKFIDLYSCIFSSGLIEKYNGILKENKKKKEDGFDASILTVKPVFLNSDVIRLDSAR